MSENKCGRFGVAHAECRPFVAGQTDLGGILSGTVIRSLDGDIPVEFLSPGDRIVTRNAGSAPLRAIDIDHVREASVAFLPRSLSDTCPEQEIVLPVSQPVLLRDWRARVMFGQPQAVTPAGTLVDHGFILDGGEREMTLYRLIFDRDQIVYAGGLELTSMPLRTRVRKVA